MQRIHEICPGCGVQWPAVAGPTHRYIGASAACWALYAALNVGEPSMAHGPLAPLLIDAYAAQHPGLPSDQSIQSVAVHLLTLYGVLERGAGVESVLWLRTRGLRSGRTPKHARFHWLEPPAMAALGAVTVADIVAAPSPQARGAAADRYVQAVWAAWRACHAQQLARWYEQFVLSDRL